MKTLLLLSFGLLTICCGTDQGESIDYTYSISNNAGQNIKLVPYINGVPEMENAITLANNEKFTKKYTYNPPGAAGFNMTGLFKATAAGSITHVGVIYNNNHINLFTVFSEQCPTCANIPNNPYPIIYNENIRNLFNISFNDEQVETYSITSEDYQNATDCGGNCY